MMQVQVRLAEPFWRAVGQRNLTVDLVADGRVADLIALLCELYPDLTQELAEAPPHIFVGDEEAESDTPLSENCQVHLVWAVAGGLF